MRVLQKSEVFAVAGSDGGGGFSDTLLPGSTNYGGTIGAGAAPRPQTVCPAGMVPYTSYTNIPANVSASGSNNGLSITITAPTQTSTVTCAGTPSPYGGAYGSTGQYEDSQGYYSDGSGDYHG